ncbi:MAG TPA: TonB family protein [Drouetiella sp.]
MGANYERGILAYQTKQYKHAEKEFREELVKYPNSAPAHAMLGMTLTAMNKGALGHKEALESVRLLPHYAYGHYTLSYTFAAMAKAKEAEKAINEAIRLDPDEAYLFARASQIQFWQKRFPQALEMAEAGLKQDAGHEECLINRAGALIELDRIDEAEEACNIALQAAPQNSSAHINAGAVYLRKLDHVKAFEHYREALRLNPSSEQARTGVIEALKSRHKLYHVLLKFSLWCRRLPPWAIVIILCLVIPPPTRAIVGLFLLSYMFANSLFELALHLDPVGKGFVKDRKRDTWTFSGQSIRWALGIMLLGFVTALLAALLRESHIERDHNHTYGKQLVADEPVDSFNFTEYKSYMSYIQSRIKRHWYPPYAPDLVASCKVAFKIAKSGEVSSVRILQSSGNEMLDKASMRAVKNASPLPKLPNVQDKPKSDKARGGGASKPDNLVDVEFTFDYNGNKVKKSRTAATNVPSGTNNTSAPSGTSNTSVPSGANNTSVPSGTDSPK